MKYLVIGAGPVGLGLAKVLKDRNIAYEQAEADSEVGGNWYHGVYKTAHVLSCKTIMEYPGYPMPESYPEFPSQTQVCDYLIDYSHRFGLREHIMFERKVVAILPLANNTWSVSFADGEEKIYKGVLICNGHHWCKRHPQYNGVFTGEYFHSKDYKGPEQLVNKKTLVIGAGNSGCDIACEAARVGNGAHLSMRRSVWIFPKTFMGTPVGAIKVPKIPKFVEHFLLSMLVRMTFGKHSHYKMDKPDYSFFDRHPTVSEELPYYLRHGKVAIRPDIERYDGNEVVFTDGSRERYDLVVAATGYNLSFPFLPKELVRGEHCHLDIYGHAAYDDYKGLYFVGWQQVRGGVGSLIGTFASVVADFIEVEEEFDLPIGMVLKVMGEKNKATHLMGSGEVFRWVKKMSKKKLQKKARVLANRQHHNVPLTMPEQVKPVREMEVY